MCSSPDRSAFNRSATALSAIALIATTVPVTAQRFTAVDAAIHDGITTGIYPGAVVVIGRADTILYARGYGHYTWSPASPMPDPTNTRWDLASLTKIVAASSSAAVLVQQKKLDLDAPVSHYLPDFVGGRKGSVTVRMLLNHTSGMPPYVKFWLSAHSVAEARRQLVSTPLRRAPGISAEYSDLNAMLMGLIVERVSGQPLELFAESSVFQPLGMMSTHYRPTLADKTNAAPTGRYHGQPVGGVVNDQNAVALGGVSGHAGVFSTGLDMAKFAQAWLKATNDKGKWLTRNTVAEFFTHTMASGTRVLGWDTPLPPGGKKMSLYGKCATTSTYGHTGWTGTEMWIDPAQNLFVVLLTNRSFAPTNPKESFLQLKDVRAKVADATRAVLGECRV